MNFGIITTEPDFQRVAQQRDNNENITSYGNDNLYPQRMKQVLLLSPIAKSAVSLTSSFIRGDGFERGSKIISSQNETANQLLKLISEDQSLYNSFGLHINSSGIGKVSTVDFVDFEYIRFGLKNKKGLINDVKVSINWEESNKVLPDPNINAQKFTLYDPAKSGGEALSSGKGMILYSTPRKNQYPLSSIDAIIESCQADYELSVYELSQIVNGFLNLSIFKYPSGGDTEDEEEELRKKLNQLKGSKNASSVIVASIDEDYEGGSLIETIPTTNGDSLFVNMTANIKSRILQSFNAPPSLLGLLPTGSLFTAQQIADDYTYMNLRTKDIRNQIEAIFNDTLGLNVGKIIPNSFESSQMLTNKPVE